MTEVTVVLAAALGIAAILSAMIVWRRRGRKIEQTGEVNRSGEGLEVWRNVAGGKYGAISETDVINLLKLGIEEVGVVDDDGRWQRARIDRMEPWSVLARHAITDAIEHGEPTPRHRQLGQDFPPAEAAKERMADIQDSVAHSACMLGLIELRTSDPCRDPELAELGAARVHKSTQDGTWERIKGEVQRRRRDERRSRTAPEPQGSGATNGRGEEC